jgi:dienelactone hydrolase
MRCTIAGLLLLLAGAAGAAEMMVRVPMPAAGPRGLEARVCLPDGAGPFRVAVINHGSPPDPSRRSGMRPSACGAEAIAWFVARGFAVLLPMRRGYGGTGGAWAETYGRCADPDFVAAGRESARDIAAAIGWAAAQPWARKDGVVAVGQSAGGWGVLALAADPPAPVSAIVNMAGGRGGRAQKAANTNCAPDRLAQAAARFGATARLPTLWIYAANDSYFAPAIPAAMQAAFSGAGGRAELHQVGAFGQDGHMLFTGRGGSAIWGPLVARFLGIP